MHYLLLNAGVFCWPVRFSVFRFRLTTANAARPRKACGDTLHLLVAHELIPGDDHGIPTVVQISDADVAFMVATCAETDHPVFRESP